MEHYENRLHRLFEEWDGSFQLRLESTDPGTSDRLERSPLGGTGEASEWTRRGRGHTGPMKCPNCNYDEAEVHDGKATCPKCNYEWSP